MGQPSSAGTDALLAPATNNIRAADCRRNDGMTGLIVGGGVGALIGRELHRGGSQAVGTIIGAGTGAMLGREIDRGSLRCD